MEDQTVFCWGQNNHGQLGMGFANGTEYSTPQPVIGLENVDSIVSSTFSSCATINSASETYCWGLNNYGELGLNSSTTVFATPTKMVVDYAGSGTVKSLGGAILSFCGVNSTGGAHCVGLNDAGQLGDGTFDNKKTIVPVIGLGTGVKQIASSQRYAMCAVMDNGEARCWGGFYDCCIGDGSASATSEIPVVVVGEKDHKQIVLGFFNTCSIRGPYNEVWCWGSNEFGELGNGTTVGVAYVPQRVLYGEPSSRR